MPVLRVERIADPRLDDYRNVADPELVRRRGMFVAEGRLVVQRLLESGHRVVSLLLNDAAYSSLRDRLDRIPEVPIYVCSTDELASIVGFKLHRGCLALAARPADRAPADVVNGADLILALEGVTDADNVGSAFRNAAAFGAGAVLLNPACCDPLYRKAIRTSMGSVLQVPYARMSAWPAELSMLRAQGFTVVAMTLKRHAIDLQSVARRKSRQRMALVIGGEGSGLTPEAESLADVLVRIPISAAVDSLNLATAAGIALHYFSNPESRIPNPDMNTSS
jgi:tRNA G18 (ribose-2'-O)-methylase SpoU